MTPDDTNIDGVTWTGDVSSGYTLEIESDAAGQSAAEKKIYKLADGDLKMEQIVINASNITIDGNKANTKITNGTGDITASKVWIAINGDDVLFRNFDIDFSSVTAAGENPRKSMQTIVITKNNTTVSDSTIKAANTDTSSSQVIVAAGNANNTTIKNNTLVAGSASTNPDYSGSVAVRAAINANHITVTDNIMDCTSAATSRNSGIGLDGIRTASVVLTVKNNTFHLANTQSNPNCAAIYISPGSADPVINLATDSKNKAGQGSNFSNFIYADKSGNSGLVSVTLTSPVGTAVYGLEGKTFMDYEDGLKAVFKDLTAANGFGGKVPKKITTTGNVSLNNLIFTDPVRMIEPSGNLTVTNSVFGEKGIFSSHAICSAAATPLTALTLDSNTFEGSFRKGALIFTNGCSTSPVVIKKNVFNGSGWDWTDDPANNSDKVNKTSALTIVADASTTVTMADNTFENYYKVLSVDHSPENGNWTIDNNTFKNVAYALDINGLNVTYKYNMTYSYFTDAAGQTGTVPKILNSSGGTTAEYVITQSDSIVSIYPYYLDAGRKNLQKDEATTESVKNLVNGALGNITNLPSVSSTLNESAKQAVSDAVNETKQLPIGSLKTEMSTPSGLNAIQKLDELQKAAGNITVTASENVSVIGAALSAAPDTEVAITAGPADLNAYPALPETPNSVVIDIQMTVDENVISDLAAPIHITLDIPEGIDRTKPIVIIHYRGGTTPEEIQAAVSGTKMSFIVTGFSPFVITNGAAVGNGGSGGSGTGSATVVNGTTSPAPAQTPANDSETTPQDRNNTPAKTNESAADEKTPEGVSSSNLKWILLGGTAIVIAGAAVFLYTKNKKE